MRTVVLIKQVPESEELRYDPATRTLVREGVASVINPYDKRALTEAVRLRGLHGGTITAVTMGPPAAREALVECLGRGVDRCMHVTDRALAGSDTLATARALAAALGRAPFDLLLLGKYSTDSETGHTGPQLAEMLGVPCVTGATEVHVDADEGALHVTRETDTGFEEIVLPMPAVLTAAEHLIKPVKTTPQVLEAGRTRIARDPSLIETLSAYDLGLDPEQVGLAGSPTWVADLRPVTVVRERRVLSGDARSMAVTLLAELDRMGLADPARRPSPPTLPAPTARPDPDRGVWSVAEVLPGGTLRRVSLELAGEASRLASLVGGEAAAVLLGGESAGDAAGELARHGAGRVFVASDARLEPANAETLVWVLARAIERYRPWAVLLPATSYGKDLAPRVAARLGLGLTADCLGFELDPEGRLLQLKPAFGGQVVAPIVSRTLPQMATVRPGLLPVYAPREAAPRVEPLDLTGLPEPLARVVSVTHSGSEGVALDDARLVVSVGTGIGGPEALPEIRTLAEALGRRLGLSPDEVALGGTRKVVDAGWLPRQQQVGITGRAVAPDLYVGIGLQGNFNHVAGMMRSHSVVALNSDPDAPIFKAADLGVVCDWREFAAALIEEMSSGKARAASTP
ncbi:MAG TPA: FAD-binding protein [Chloroflexia bacterium]|nr:FAD-binding protein [Chloroflexia bacterium]